MTMTALPETAHVIRRVILDGISWESYQRLVNEVGPSVRLTYDRGRLEIMSPSQLHERVKTVLARLIEAYSDEMEMTVEGFGSMTLGREILKRGLEPDECYYISNVQVALTKEKLDLSVDPPPDLAIEVDISPPGLERPPIYAALRVPEIWRYDGHLVMPLLLRPDGEYVASDQSPAFPDLPMAEVNRLLGIGLASGQSAAVRALREWLRKR